MLAGGGNLGVEVHSRPLPKKKPRRVSAEGPARRKRALPGGRFMR